MLIVINKRNREWEKNGYLYKYMIENILIYKYKIIFIYFNVNNIIYKCVNDYWLLILLD